MKRLVCLCLVIFSILFMFPVISYADDSALGGQPGDDFYIVVTTQEYITRSSNTRSGNKIYTGYSGDNSVAWEIILSASFKYDGTTSSCTSSSCSVIINDNSWIAASHSSSKSGNTAYGTATLKHQVLGVVTSTSTHNLSLTCDKNGNLS